MGRGPALGIVFTGLSTLVYATLLRHVTAQTAGVLTFLEPVSGVALAWLLLDQRPGTATLVGGALVLAAGIVVVLLEPADGERRGRPGRGRIAHGMSAEASRTPPDRNLALELVRVTEAAAMGASRWIGRGDKNAADQAAVDLCASWSTRSRCAASS